ncbi:gamma-glutamyltransferase [Ignavibacteriales bacterium]
MLKPKSIFSKMRYLTLLFASFSLIFGSETFAQKVSQEGGMVVSADSIATEVGISILRSGGNAIDAAVGVGFALAVTYPVAGNIGGGGFMVIRLEKGDEITLDYREKAPAMATRDMYLDSSGNFIESLAQDGILAGGVPGSVSGMLTALDKFGTMKREQVIGPALKLAKEGFYLSIPTANSFKKYNKSFNRYPSTAKIFTKNGEPLEENELFIQTDLARSLELIIKEGTKGFYSGETAEKITAHMKKEHGLISLDDLAKYETVLRKPVTGSYKGYKIISMPPPSSGGVALIQLLNILENVDLTALGHSSPEYLHNLVEAMRRVYADRSEYLGDPDFYKVPMKELISKEYAKKLFKTISNRATPSNEVKPGLEIHKESLETTHYSVIDRWGNAVSVTTTINSGYGSKLVIEGTGFFLNNEMDDFSAKPGVPNQFGLLGSEANSISAGKRMLSSMTPTIVLKDNSPFLILGSPGGSTIITSVLQVILNVIDFGYDVRAAVDAPRIHHQWFPDLVAMEDGVLDHHAKESFMNMGYEIKDISHLGLIEAILIDQKSGKISGASDRRGVGLAKGEKQK